MYLNQFGFNIIQIQIDTQREVRPVKSDTLKGVGPIRLANEVCLTYLFDLNA